MSMYKVIRVLHIANNYSNFLSSTGIGLYSNLHRVNANHIRKFSNDMQEFKKSIDPNAKPEKKKKIIRQMVTLLMPDNSMSVNALEDAQKIANRRNLKLVKIVDFDTKAERPVYKLMTPKQLLEEELKSKSLKQKSENQDIKGTKLLSLSSKIGDHDVEAKIKNILKAISKKYEIRLLITCDGNIPAAEAVYQKIVDAVKQECQVSPKIANNSSIKVSLRPVVALNDTEESVS